METERDVLNKIINSESGSIKGLLDRHGCLFHEGLVRFFGKADLDEADHLSHVLVTMCENLRAGDFNDLSETFYDWVMKDACRTFMALRLKDSGSEGHIEPSIIYECADPLNRAALPEDIQKKVETHLESCELCLELLDLCTDIPVEKRHAGAPFPDQFLAVIDKVLSN